MKQLTHMCTQALASRARRGFLHFQVQFNHPILSFMVRSFGLWMQKFIPQSSKLGATLCSMMKTHWVSGSVGGGLMILAASASGVQTSSQACRLRVSPKITKWLHSPSLPI